MAKHILLIIGGGIAAFKSLDLIRRLRERGHQVTPVLTRAGAEFVTPLSVSGLAATKVYLDLFDLTDEAEMGHIELSRAADLVVVAPATADLMAKMAGGHANDLASTLLMATDKRERADVGTRCDPAQSGDTAGRRHSGGWPKRG